MIKNISLATLFVLILLPLTSALTSGEGAIIFGSIFSMSIIILFFLVLSIIINNGPMKVFFMSMSFLTILASVGMGVSVMQEFFSSLTNIVDAYGQFYILLITLTIAGLFALIIWLIIVSVKSFNINRGLVDNDDE